MNDIVTKCVAYADHNEDKEVTTVNFRIKTQKKLVEYHFIRQALNE